MMTDCAVAEKRKREKIRIFLKMKNGDEIRGDLWVATSSRVSDYMNKYNYRFISLTNAHINNNVSPSEFYGVAVDEIMRYSL